MESADVIDLCDEEDDPFRSQVGGGCGSGSVQVDGLIECAMDALSALEERAEAENKPHSNAKSDRASLSKKGKGRAPYRTPSNAKAGNGTGYSGVRGEESANLRLYEKREAEEHDEDSEVAQLLNELLACISRRSTRNAQKEEIIKLMTESEGFRWILRRLLQNDSLLDLVNAPLFSMKRERAS